MSVLVYAESWKGSFRKSTFEAISYANETAKLLNTNLIAFSIGEVSDEVLKEVGNYGAEKIISFDSESLVVEFSSSNFANISTWNGDMIFFASLYIKLQNLSQAASSSFFMFFKNVPLLK